MTNKPLKTIRLSMPQWQGGDYDMIPPLGTVYPVGTQLLATLAPKSDAPLIEVPIVTFAHEARSKQNGIVWQDVIMQQFKAAQEIIEMHKPDRIITFGGDCHVSQAPFAYLNEHYQGNLGVIWIDSHPDISTPENFDREHAMVLGNLLGHGDPALSKEVKKPFQSSQVLLVGVDSYNSPYEKRTIQELGLKTLPISKAQNESQSILKWIEENKFNHVAIHLDVDALDPTYFYSQLTKNPNSKPFDTVTGKMTIQQLTTIITDISNKTEVVGMSFTEFMPWDAVNLKNMMAQFSFMKCA